MAEIPRHVLKHFFSGPEAAQAEVNLSASYAETLSMGDLFALEPGAEEAFRALDLNYPGLYGSSSLRQALAARYPEFTAEEVQVFSGLDDALALISTTFLEPGDRVIVQSPCYQPHNACAYWRDAIVENWQGREDQGWAPDLDDLRELLRKPAKFVLVNFPHNPTGFIPDKAFVEALVAILREHDCRLISDEIYSGLPPQTSIPAMATIYEKAVSLHGMSKIFGLPGLRVGWAVSRDQEFHQGVKRLRDYFGSFVPVANDHLSQLALRHESKIVARNVDILQSNQTIAADFFHKHANLFDWQAPRAGVNGFPRWHGPQGTEDLSRSLMTGAKVLLAPSVCFGAGDRNLRFGLGCRDMARGLERLDYYLEQQFGAGGG